MFDLTQYKIWFFTGSQHLYGDDVLKQVAANSRDVVGGLNGSGRLPLTVEFKDVLTTADAISAAFRDANADPSCAGVMLWMHTFSPAKMWIGGLSHNNKPLLHLHTQHNRDLPWSTIDMDFMNLTQSAHGDREFGHICTRLNVTRKVVAGHWSSPDVHARVARWMRAASAFADSKALKVARFGDNMRNVAVTEGDKVAAEMTFGYSVNGFGIGDLTDVVATVSDSEIDDLCATYADQYKLEKALASGGDKHESLREEARVELGLRRFLDQGGFRAFTDTFEDLHGLKMLPGLAVQRLMADGYGFGAEGDWKTAALVRAFKVMTAGCDEGATFMEDYTYHLDPEHPYILGAHMLEICPSVAAAQPECIIRPLGIGGKADPVRLVFDAAPGAAIAAGICDLGHRFRIIANTVDIVKPPHATPNLPVARALWDPKPSLATSTEAWILAGGPHHTALSRAVDAEQLEDFCDIAGIELALIDESTDLRRFKQELRWSDQAYSAGR